MKKKVLLGTILLLLVLNVASLGMLWYQNSHRPAGPQGQPPRGPEAVARLIVSELNLSDQQKEKLEQLRKEHFTEVSRTQAEIYKAKRAILQEVAAPEPDTAKISRLASEIGQNQGRFERFLFDHFLAIKWMLTPEQTQKYDQLLHDVTEASRPPGLQRFLLNPEGGPPPDDLARPPAGPPPDDRRTPQGAPLPGGNPPGGPPRDDMPARRDRN